MPILGYLINPALQIEDVNGKPLVGGTIRVFRHGTTIPYITWKDFTGDRNPATVVLDAKGMAILLAEPGYLYDVYCEDRHGVPQWSRLNVPVEAGGMGISSSDGSLVISQTDTGGGVVYDITVAQDSGEMLEWLRTDGYTDTELGMRPDFSAGTMAVGNYGVRLAGGVYYHVTARVKATVDTLRPDYNEFDILFKGWSEGGSYTFLDRPVVIDGSITSTQEWEISFDAMPSADVELYVATDGLSQYNAAELLDMEIHRVYSGIPRIPDGVADKPWVEENFQEKLTAGEGIEIDANNVISVDWTFEQQQADWAQTDTEAVDYIKNKPTIPSGSQLVPASTPSDAGEVLTVGQDGTPEWAPTQVDNDTAFLAHYGVTTYAEISDAVAAGKAVVLTDMPLATTAILTMSSFSTNPAQVIFGTLIGADEYTARLASDTWSYTSVSIQADWSETNQLRASYIANKPANLVQDASYVHTDNNFTDADVTKLSGIQAGAEVNVQSDWNENDSTSDSFIQNKPTIPSGSQLVPAATSSDAGEVLTVNLFGTPEWRPAQAPISAGDGIDITNNVVSAKVDGTSVTFNADGELEATAAPQVQSDWAESDSADVSFIRNKPGQTSLVAGANITIVDDAQNNTVTISAAATQAPVQDVTVGNVSVVNAQGVAEIPSIPVIGTITL